MIGDRVRLTDWEKRMKDRGSFAAKGKTGGWWVETGGVVRGVKTKDSGEQTRGLAIRQQQQTLRAARR